MSYNTACMAAACIKRAYVVAARDITLAAVAHCTDYTAHVTAAVNIGTVPAVYKVCAVTPFGDTAEERSVYIFFADFAACDTDILNYGILADSSEKSAAERSKIVYDISVAVKYTVKLISVRAYRGPVVIVAEVDIIGHFKVNTGSCHKLGIYVI